MANIVIDVLEDPNADKKYHAPQLIRAISLGTPNKRIGGHAISLLDSLQSRGYELTRLSFDRGCSQLKDEFHEQLIARRSVDERRNEARDSHPELEEPPAEAGGSSVGSDLQTLETRLAINPVAVPVGFEPTVELPPHMFSRHDPSAARTRYREKVYTIREAPGDTQHTSSSTGADVRRSVHRTPRG